MVLKIETTEQAIIRMKNNLFSNFPHCVSFGAEGNHVSIEQGESNRISKKLIKIQIAIRDYKDDRQKHIKKIYIYLQE